MRGHLSRLAPGLVSLLRRPGDVAAPSLLYAFKHHPDDVVRLAAAATLKAPPFDAIPSPHEWPILVRAINDRLRAMRADRQLLLPNLHDSGTIAVFSDYGGDEADSAYLSYSFVFVNYDLVFVPLKELADLRAKHHAPMEMSFKRLGNTGQLTRMLPEWLGVGDGIHGLLFTLLVDKDLDSVVMRDSRRERDRMAVELASHGFGAWKPETAERLIRIVHVIGYLSALLSRPDHQVWWMTDKDPIAANDEKTEGMKKLLGNVLSKYRPDPYKKSGFALPWDSVDDPNIDFRDILSYADLAAGALANGLTAHRRKTKPKPKSESILEFLSNQSIWLRKVQIVLHPHPGEMVRAGTVMLANGAPPRPGVQFVDVEV